MQRYLQACGDTADWCQSETTVLSRGQVLRGLHGPPWNLGLPPKAGGNLSLQWSDLAQSFVLGRSQWTTDNVPRDYFSPHNDFV